LNKYLVVTIPIYFIKIVSHNVYFSSHNKSQKIGHGVLFTELFNRITQKMGFISTSELITKSVPSISPLENSKLGILFKNPTNVDGKLYRYSLMLRSKHSELHWPWWAV
jgi:hypothetical protein